MNETAKALTKPELGSVTKDRSLFARILANCVRRCYIDTAGKALIVGGSIQDVGILQSAGFRSMTLSTFQPVSREMSRKPMGWESKLSLRMPNVWNFRMNRTIS